MIRDQPPRDQRMAYRWSGWIVRHAQAVLVTSILLCAVLIPLALTATEHTVPDGWLPDSATAVQVQELARQELGRSDTTFYLLFSDPSGNLQANEAMEAGAEG